VILDVDVTQACIDLGKPGNCRQCPIWLGIAIALGKRLPEWADQIAAHLCVNSFYIQHQYCDGSWRINTPIAASMFIGLYDSGRAVRPFAFTLRIPDSLLRQAGVPDEAMAGAV